MALDIRYEITAGPSKMDLMLALFDQPVIDGVAQKRSVRFAVESVTDNKYRVTVGDVDIIIDSVSREDGSYESWNFEGRFVPRPGDHLHPRVKGHYSTRHRKGVYSCVYPE